MTKTIKKVSPLMVAGIAGLALAGCSTYGAGDYGYGRSYPSAAYRAPYSYGHGSVYAAPYGYNRPAYSYPSRGYSGSHNGYGHLGGRRH